jgi:hypothetical protein
MTAGPGRGVASPLWNRTSFIVMLLVELLRGEGVQPPRTMQNPAVVVRSEAPDWNRTVAGCRDDQDRVSVRSGCSWCTMRQ